MRKFLIESADGDYNFSTSTTRAWTLEEMLREINRDTTCTDMQGNVTLPNGSEVMAGSPLDTVDHEKENCFRPYTTEDWEEGWYNWSGEEYHRIIDVLA